MQMARAMPRESSSRLAAPPTFVSVKDVAQMKRSIIVKVLAVLLTLALASTAAASTTRADIDGGGGYGGGLSGAGTGNF